MHYFQTAVIDRSSLTVALLLLLMSAAILVQGGVAVKAQEQGEQSTETLEKDDDDTTVPGMDNAVVDAYIDWFVKGRNPDLHVVAISKEEFTSPAPHHRKRDEQAK